MSPQLWSYGLAVIGITGILLAGRKVDPWIGWAVGLTAQALWVAYALATRQYGFIASALAYGAVYALNVGKALPARRRATAARDTWPARAFPRHATNTATTLRPGEVAVAGALGANATECPVCPDHRRIALPLLAGHLYRHELLGEG